MKTTKFLTTAALAVIAAASVYAVPNYKEYESYYYSTQFSSEQGPDSSSETLTLKVSDTINRSGNYFMLAMSPEAVNLEQNLTTIASGNDNTVFGYYLTRTAADGTSTTTFVSLSSAIANAEYNMETVTLDNGESFTNRLAKVSLGSFSAGDSIAFGYGQENSNSIVSTLSGRLEEPSYYTGYNVDKYYQLDFSTTPFDGQLEFLVAGEPLPTQVVTLLIALAAGVGLVYYRSRRERLAANA